MVLRNPSFFIMLLILGQHVWIPAIVRSKGQGEGTHFVFKHTAQKSIFLLISAHRPLVKTGHMACVLQGKLGYVVLVLASLVLS